MLAELDGSEKTRGGRFIGRGFGGSCESSVRVRMGICWVTRVYRLAARQAVVASDEQELPWAGKFERPTRLVLILHVKQKAEAKDEGLSLALLLVKDAKNGVAYGQPSRAVVMELSFVVLSAERERKVLCKSSAK
jgi:hypothetical protein